MLYPKIKIDLENTKIENCSIFKGGEIEISISLDKTCLVIKNDERELFFNDKDNGEITHILSLKDLKRVSNPKTIVNRLYDCLYPMLKKYMKNENWELPDSRIFDTVLSSLNNKIENPEIFADGYGNFYFTETRYVYFCKYEGQLSFEIGFGHDKKSFSKKEIHEFSELAKNGISEIKNIAQKRNFNNTKNKEWIGYKFSLKKTYREKEFTKDVFNAISIMLKI